MDAVNNENKKLILDKIGFKDFTPFPFLTSPISQTIVAHYRPPYTESLNTPKHLIQLPDGDILVLMDNIPPTWKKGDRIILLIHGLTGSYLSNYNIRVSKLLLEHNYRVMRLNLRGCGPGLGLARFPYHAGSSTDTNFVLNWIAKHYPASPITQIGFSLGGNITLKMLGEDLAVSLPTQLDSAIAVAPPVDILNSNLLLSNKKNKIFDQYFVKKLLQHAERCHQHFPDLPAINLPKDLNLYTFNDLYIAPRAGFLNALDYYSQTSAGPLLKNIDIQTLVLHAKDDPFVCVEQYLPCSNPKIDFLSTHNGGHLGWMAVESKNGKMAPFEWMDHLLVHWLKWFEKQ